MPDKPMTPEELAERAVNLVSNSYNPQHHIAVLITAYTESIRREAKLEEAEVWNNNAGVTRLDLVSEWAKFRLNGFHSLPIDTPPAAAEEDYGVPGATMSRMTAEAVCPRCSGIGAIRWAGPEPNQCPDCHGTGKAGKVADGPSRAEKG
jgi:hypothetical protein